MAYFIFIRVGLLTLHFIRFQITVVWENGLSLWYVFITLNRKLLNFAVPMCYQNREVNARVKRFASSGATVLLRKSKAS